MIFVGCVNGRHSSFDSSWTVISTPSELTQIQPGEDTLYSIHWSWKIPESIHVPVKTVGFHSTDLPYGRGGDPIGNLLKRGFRETMVTAFEVGKGWDTGAILMKRPVSLDGTRDQILDRIYPVCSDMIRYLEHYGPPMRIPQDEYGKTTFRRNIG